MPSDDDSGGIVAGGLGVTGNNVAAAAGGDGFDGSNDSYGGTADGVLFLMVVMIPTADRVFLIVVMVAMYVSGGDLMYHMQRQRRLPEDHARYTKPKGQLPDYESPVVLKNGLNSIEDFCNQLHKSIMKEFKQISRNQMID
ncbi:predicted protein [Nematostella vectensis]|uniref:TGS domain-containing protein n=1 Tax=Nematostella vectensis TaxID=45351 RepID=A7S8U8_NEMVE|nr:predicted protein [Nematostella vectensis]|eukprot:XP_001631954.1 predicted protein [Nematostella vectensis]